MKANLLHRFFWKIGELRLLFKLKDNRRLNWPVCHDCVPAELLCGGVLILLSGRVVGGFVSPTDMMYNVCSPLLIVWLNAAAV